MDGDSSTASEVTRVADGGDARSVTSDDSSFYGEYFALCGSDH